MARASRGAGSVCKLLYKKKITIKTSFFKRMTTKSCYLRFFIYAIIVIGVLFSASRHTSSVAGPPPSQQQTEFSTTTKRFLRVEEQQLEIQRLNAQILQSFLERSAE